MYPLHSLITAHKLLVVDSRETALQLHTLSLSGKADRKMTLVTVLQLKQVMIRRTTQKAFTGDSLLNGTVSFDCHEPRKIRASQLLCPSDCNCAIFVIRPALSVSQNTTNLGRNERSQCCLARHDWRPVHQHASDSWFRAGESIASTARTVSGEKAALLASARKRS